MKHGNFTTLSTRWLCCCALLSTLLLTACVSNSPEDRRWDKDERAEIHVQLGMDYLKRGSYDTAREEFDLALKADKRSSRAHHAKGLLSEILEDYTAADKSFRTAVKYNPENYVAVNDYGTFLCQRGDVEKGLTLLEKVLQKSANSYLLGTHLGLGTCYRKSRRLGASDKHFREALSYNGRLTQALFPLAQNQYEQANYLSARAFLQRCIAAGGITEDSVLLGVRIELQLDNKSGAQTYAREFRMRFPRSNKIGQLNGLL